MAKKIEIEVEEDEVNLLKIMRATIDFYGQGYDDRKGPNERKGNEIFQGFVKKILDAIK